MRWAWWRAGAPWIWRSRSPRRTALGAVAVRNSSHFGAAGYYVDHAAALGLIGLAFTNASPAIAPTGGTEGLFGTNPIGVGFPLRNAEPIIADMATAMVARSRIRHMLAAGQKTHPGRLGARSAAAGRPPIRPKRSKARCCRSADRRATRCR